VQKYSTQKTTPRREERGVTKKQTNTLCKEVPKGLKNSTGPEPFLEKSCNQNPGFLEHTERRIQTPTKIHRKQWARGGRGRSSNQESEGQKGSKFVLNYKGRRLPRKGCLNDI